MVWDWLRIVRNASSHWSAVLFQYPAALVRCSVLQPRICDQVTAIYTTVTPEMMDGFRSAALVASPFPYAQFTVVRTAITAAATASWMVHGSDAEERRARALEFYFNDFKSNALWMDTVNNQPMLQNASAAVLGKIASERAMLDTRRDLIVQMANALHDRQIPFTRRTFGQNTTSDTEMVRIAGAATPGLGRNGFDAAITLLNTWQAMSCYAHARTWATLPGKHASGETDPVTGMQKVTQKGDPHALLDAAFRPVLVVEQAVGQLVALSVA